MNLRSIRMRGSARPILLVLGVAFAAYFAVRALVWNGAVIHPWVLIAASAVVFVVTCICLFVPSSNPSTNPDAPLTAGSRGPSTMPTAAAFLAVVVAAIVPSAVSLSVPEDVRFVGHATTYLGAIGVLLTIVTVRRRAAYAWVGVLFLAAAAFSWLGPLRALAFGLTGSIMWVLIAQLVLRGMDRLANDSLRLVSLQHTAVAWRRANEARNRERRIRVQYTLRFAGPVLEQVIATSGHLSDEQRLEARVAEGALRDFLRAGRLLGTSVRDELNRARARGIVVTIVDEGGLEELSEADLEAIHRELASAIAGARSERLIIRSSRRDDVAVSVVGRDRSSDPDDDDVSLWLEIARPAVSS